MSAEQLCFELPGGGVEFTTRAHGNMSSRRGAGAGQADHARARLQTELRLSRLLRGRQVHGAIVVRTTRPEGSPGAAKDADGQATVLPNVGVMVLTADCLPVAVASRAAVAMLHAGWRGLVAGVLEQGVQAVRELAADGEIVAVIGPGAGECCYEVGPEVQAALGLTPETARRIDLSALARERLQGAGVVRVHESRACTICDRRFFSHRREGARAGRQAGVAWLR